MENMTCNVGVSCRAATSDDKSAVFAINREVHGGLDYFPDRYEDTVNDSNCFCYVLEKDGQIIGFAGHRVLMNDRATVAGNMRLRKEHQGKGLMKILDQYILQKVQQAHPSIETYRYITSNAAQVKKHIEDPASGFRLAAHLISYRLETTTSEVKAKLKKKRILEHHSVFSVKELVTSHSNTQLQLNIGQTFVHSALHIPANSKWENIVAAAEKIPAYATLGDGNTFTAVSFSDLHISSRGYVISVHFSSHDGATFDSHFLRHLEDIINNIPSGKAKLFIRVLGPLNQETFKPVLAEYGEIAEEREVYIQERTLK